MAALTWNDTFVLQQPRMDDTHREFVALLADVEEALERPQAELAERFALFIGHTEDHFAQEDRWMRAIGFQAENCHTYQHAHVLQVLREVQRRLAEDADVDTVKLLVQELAQWFPSHAQNMDAALAESMLAVGFDPESETLQQPLDASVPARSTCGSASCA